MSNTIAQSTPNARTFVVTQGGQYHTAWDASGSSYDPISGALTQDGAQRIKDAATKQELHFSTVMEELKRMNPRDDAIQRFDIRAGHSWQEVVDVASQAKDAYYDRAKGIKGLFKRVGMKIGELNPVLDPVLQTLPCGDYTSIVCGGVILIFRSFARMHEIRSKTMNMLHQTPWLLEQVEMFIKLYPNNVRLSDKVDQLYTALLRAITASIQWFGHGIWDRFKALALQGLYGQNIDSCISLVQECAQNLRDQVALCDQEKNVEIYELLMNNMRDMNEVKAQAMQQEFRAQQRHDEMMGAGSKLSDQLTSIEAGLKSQFTLQFENQKQIDGSRDATLNSILKLLSNQESNKGVVLQWLEDARAEKEKERERREAAEQQARHLQGQLIATKIELQRTPSPVSTLTCGEVQHLLWDCGEMPETQIELHARLDVDESFLASTISAYKFHRWFTSRESQILFLRTDGSISASACSAFVVSFAMLCKRLPKAATVTYFCGRQAANPAHDPVSVMLGYLVLQLLPSEDQNLKAWSGKLPLYEHHRQLGLKDLNYLKSFFRYLILPREQGGHREAGAIFILIDSFAALEQTATPESLWDLICYLKYRLIASTSTRPVVLKFLIVRPDRRGDVVNRMDDDVLNVGRTAQRGSGSSSQHQLEFELERARRME